MGGEGPYVQFEPTRYLWDKRRELQPLSDEELEAAYARARKFFLDQVAELKTGYGWKDVFSVSDTIHLRYSY
jgi:hypothetical protein